VKKDIISSSVYTFFQYGFNFFSQIYLARILLPETYGQYAILIAYGAIINILSSFSFNESYIQAEEKENTFDYIFKITGFLIIVRLILYIVFFLIAATFIDKNEIIYLIIIVSVKLFMPFNNIFLTRYDKAYGVNYSSKILLIFSSISMLVTIFFALNGFGIWSLILREILPIIFTFIFFYKKIWLSIKNISKSEKLSFDGVKPFFNYSTKYYLSQITETSFFKVPILIIDYFYSSTIVSYFYQMMYLVNVPIRFLNHFNQKIAFFYFSKNKNNDLFFFKNLKLILTINVLSVPFVLLFYLIPETTINIVLGENWINGASILKYLSILVIFISLYNLFQSYLYSINKIKTIIFSSLIGIVIFATGGMILGNQNFNVSSIIVLYTIVHGILCSILFYSFWRNFKLKNST
jgi:O-antigen/teichoic acid export membrane protein